MYVICSIQETDDVIFPGNIWKDLIERMYVKIVLKYLRVVPKNCFSTSLCFLTYLKLQVHLSIHLPPPE